MYINICSFLRRTNIILIYILIFVKNQEKFLRKLMLTLIEQQEAKSDE